MTFSTDMLFHLKALTRCLFYVTDEEDRFITDLQEATLKHKEARIYVYNSIYGSILIKPYMESWSARAAPEDKATVSIHDTLAKVQSDDTRDSLFYYVITDPERWLQDPQVQRRVLNILQQFHHNEYVHKTLIFVGSRLYIPPKLQRYIEVVHDSGVSDAAYMGMISNLSNKLKIKPQLEVAKDLRGLTTFEATSAIIQSYVKAKCLKPELIQDFRKKQLAKTDLLDYIDVSSFSFDSVGGNDQFKAWATKTKATWTEEGREFGLRPPKGVLAVGVWGCGKSLSVKALGNAWNLPVVQFEMGRLRSSAVGESEANVYRALKIIESVAPCIIWVDEAEKSFSGGQSSAKSDAGTTSRTIGILSTWLQETKATVCMAMTANGVSTLPVEFVNRMDERFFFGVPSEEERMEILKIHLAKRNQDPAKFKLIELAEASLNMVGREIEQAIGAALVDSFNAGCPSLDPDILCAELRGKPRILRTMSEELQEIMTWVGYDPDAKDGVRARLASKGGVQGYGWEVKVNE